MSKTQNYTAEQVAEVREAYVAAGTHEDRLAVVDQFAEKFGKTVASIRSKLAHEGVYIAKPKPESKSTRVKKSELVQQIADKADLDNDSFFDSLEGANKAVLEWIISLQNAQDAE